MKNNDQIEITWPEGKSGKAVAGESWLSAARKSGITIPTGCLTGKCGACEIEVNGEVIRACISNVAKVGKEKIIVEFATDPYW